MQPKCTAKDNIREAVQQAIAIVESNLSEYTNLFQDSNTVRQFYQPVGNREWTTGFCTGEYWLSYELSGNPAFREAALVQVVSFYERIQKHIDVDHHDMGFLYTPSCVAAYKLTGSEMAKKAALLAADNLISRFSEKGQFIQAWGAFGTAGNYRLIIDCLMNLPLLYWASEMTGDEKYRRIAIAHTETSLCNLVREDNSTYHTYFFDPETGRALRGATQQGYRDGSAWARGQAWGIYGLAVSFHHTKDSKCIPLFRRVSDFFIKHLPQDSVPYWDLDFTDGDDQPKDSSAAAIAVCGMMEMAKYLGPAEAEYYREVSSKILDSLIRNYAVCNRKQSNGLLLHGTYAKSSPYNPVSDRGVDECNTWGDYFYLEALIRLTKDWDIYW